MTIQEKTCPVEVPWGSAEENPAGKPADSLSLNQHAQSSRGSSRVAVLTAGRDRPYALGLASALIGEGIPIDYIGSDAVFGREVADQPLVNFLNLRDQRENAGTFAKMFRVLSYYARLICYAARAKPKVFHILWNNKFELFDRTVLMLYYRLLGKRIVFTAHNVNAGKRDGTDSWLNRISLRIQYALADHIFVHTEMMKREMLEEFRVADSKVTVIPFGINNTLPSTGLSRVEARDRLGLGLDDRTLLFFGNIAPYKGLEYLVEALVKLAERGQNFRLIIAGRPKGSEAYWARIQSDLDRAGLRDRVISRIEYVPDEHVETFFKAADVVVLPYTHIFQSGVLFLGYSFGLPVIATNVGSLREEIEEGRTGFVCQPRDAGDLANKIENYFSSDLYRHLEERRKAIRQLANDRYSWTAVGRKTHCVYNQLLDPGSGSRGRGLHASIN